MKALSLGYAALAGAFSYLLFRQWFDRKASICAVLLLITNPMLWFYGTSTELSSFDWCLSVAVVLSCLQPRWILVSPVLMAFGAGVRPTSALFLLPVYVLCWYHFLRNSLPQHGAKRFPFATFLITHAAGAIVVATWFGILVKSAGGFAAYRALYTTHNPMENFTIAQNIYRLSSYWVYILAPNVMLAVQGLVRLRKQQHSSVTTERITPNSTLASRFHAIVWWWCAPALLVFVAVVYVKGYALIVLAGLYAYAAWALERGAISRGVVAGTILLQSALYLLLPAKQPDVRTFFAPAKRTLNAAQVWAERTQSFYAMTQAHVRLDESDIASITTLLDTSSNEAVPGTRGGRLVFLDPTLAHHVRLLQVLYPRDTIAKMDMRTADACLLGIAGGIKEQSGLQAIFARAVILSRNDLVQEYLTVKPLQCSSKGAIACWQVRLSDAPTLAAWYAEHFLRAR
jgi:hypothetical protein